MGELDFCPRDSGGGGVSASRAVEACFAAALDETRMLERSLQVALERERLATIRLAAAERDRGHLMAEVDRLRRELDDERARATAQEPSIAWKATGPGRATEPEVVVVNDREPTLHDLAGSEPALAVPAFAERDFWPQARPSRRRSLLRLLGTTAAQGAIAVLAMAAVLAAVG